MSLLYYNCADIHEVCRSILIVAETLFRVGINFYVASQDTDRHFLWFVQLLLGLFVVTGYYLGQKFIATVYTALWLSSLS